MRKVKWHWELSGFFLKKHFKRKQIVCTETSCALDREKALKKRGHFALRLNLILLEKAFNNGKQSALRHPVIFLPFKKRAPFCTETFFGSF